MWRGGNTHTGDLDYFQTEINLLIREYSDHDFSFVGIDKHNVYKFLGKKNVTVLKGIDPNYYYLRLQNIGAKVLMVPLAPNQFNLAKSNVAFIEGTWAGMAVVAPNTLEWGKPGVSNYFERGTFYRTVEKCIESDQTKNVELAWQYICDNLLLSNVNNMRVEILKNLVA
jgi:hypothetical protein